MGLEGLAGGGAGAEPQQGRQGWVLRGLRTRETTDFGVGTSGGGARVEVGALYRGCMAQRAVYRSLWPVGQDQQVREAQPGPGR